MPAGNTGKIVTLVPIIIFQKHSAVTSRANSSIVHFSTPFVFIWETGRFLAGYQQLQSDLTDSYYDTIEFYHSANEIRPNPYNKVTNSGIRANIGHIKHLELDNHRLAGPGRDLYLQSTRPQAKKGFFNVIQNRCDPKNVIPGRTINSKVSAPT